LYIYPKLEGVTGKLLMAAHPVIGGTAPDLMVGRFITSVEQY